MKIRPLPGYCLVEPIEEEEKSAGGIYMPESAKDKPMKGKVLAIGGAGYMGDNLVDITEEVHKGDIVCYKKWTNQEVQHEGKEYLLVKFDELLAVIE